MAETTPRASGLEPPDAEAFLAEIAKECHARGWALGTSGNSSAVVTPRAFGPGHHRNGITQRDIVAGQFRAR
jgi:hypothetical protein